MKLGGLFLIPAPGILRQVDLCELSVNYKPSKDAYLVLVPPQEKEAL